jgi:rubrerythrin
MEGEDATMTTIEHLLIAFARATQNRCLYDFYAAAAKKEGHNGLFTLFEQTATHEKAHAKRILRLLVDAEMPSLAPVMPIPARLGTSIENLRAAVAIEQEEHASLYPTWARRARDEGQDMVGKALESIAISHAQHALAFAEALQRLETGTLYKREEAVVWVCRKCGYVHTSLEAPVICPACLHPQGHFEIFC